MSPPTTFRGEPSDRSGIDWDAPATLHRLDDQGGLFNDMKAIRSGSLAAMVRHVMSLPLDDRHVYAVDKAGDHRLRYHEIASLASRPDFPGG